MVTLTAQLFAIFAFGFVMTGIVFLGIVRAREFAEKTKRAAGTESENSE